MDVRTIPHLPSVFIDFKSKWGTIVNFAEANCSFIHCLCFIFSAVYRMNIKLVILSAAVSLLVVVAEGKKTW